MADSVSTASSAVFEAVSGALSSVGATSIGRLAQAVDTTAHNLVDAAVSPTVKNVIGQRGYKYRNNGPPAPFPELTSQQQQVAKTSTDPRIVKFQRDSVGLITRVCQSSDAINRKHPEFADLGSTVVRLSLPVPTTSEILGFHALKIDGTRVAGPPSQDSDEDFNDRMREHLERIREDACEWLTEDVMQDVLNSFVDDDENDQEPTVWTSEQHGLLSDPLASPPRPPSPVSPPPTRQGEAFIGPGQPSNWLPGEITEDYIRRWIVMRGAVEQRRREVEADRQQALRAGAPPLVGPNKAPAASETGTLNVLGEALATAVAGAQVVVDKAQQPMIPCSMCRWLDPRNCQSYFENLMNAANPAGVRDIYVIDVMLPTQVFMSCVEAADQLNGEDKPGKNLHVQKALRKLRRIVSDDVSYDVYNYLVAVTELTAMALVLDIGEYGKNHCMVLSHIGSQPVFRDFFATQKIEDAMDDLEDAKRDAGHSTDGIIYSVPAPEVKGTLSEKLVLFETLEFGEYELKEKKMTVGAVKIGVDLMGRPSPNDHKDPLNFIGAVYRHLGDSKTVVGEGTDFEYVITLDRSKKSQLTPDHDKVWEDMISDHCSDFLNLLKDPDQRFDLDFLIDGRPNSYTNELYERWLEEQIQDERFLLADNAMCDLLSHANATQKHMQELRASAQCKKGEDSSRARAVISPGVAGNEGLHQARTSPIVKALEALHAVIYNHTNLKGLTEETKRIRFAEYLRAVPKGALVFGTDKSKNDSCFREAVWKKCVKYLAKMNDVFEDHLLTRGYVYSPNEATASESFPNGTLNLKYWIVRLTPLLAFLLSGIGPTSFMNRLESTVENGATVLKVHGKEAYEKWRIAERRATASQHPAWRRHGDPHVAQFVDWAPLAPHMVDDTTISCEKLKPEQIHTRHMGINEGDDQVHAVIPPEEWSKLSVKAKVQKYNSALSRTTNFIFEPALTADEYDMVGRKAIFEMLSAWVGLPHGDADDYEVAVIVPKVLKAIRKLPHCTISSQHSLVYDSNEEPCDVERNANFWCLGLTKFYALAIINHESLGVRGLFLAHGDYCFRQLERTIGKKEAYHSNTIYGDRDPERRGIEESASTTFQHCGVMRDHAHHLISTVRIERVARVCCAAWRSELPDLANESKENVIAALLAFDNITLTLEITENHVSDPMSLWTELDCGCILAPLVMHATGNIKKVAAQFRSSKLLADSEETVQLARQLAGTKPEGSTVKDGGSDKASAKKDAKGKGKDRDGKGQKGKGKKGPGHGKGASWRR